MTRLSGIAGTLLALIIAAIAPAYAQVAGGQISGRVTDPTGAVLPGVTVTITQTDTQLVRTAVTNELGVYSVPNLPVGPYRLEASLQLPLGEGEGLRTTPRVGQAEHAVGHLADLALEAGGPVGQRGLVRPQLRPPPLAPVVHHLAGESELPPGAGVEPAEIAPDDLALVEHGGLELGVGASPRHALAQGIQRAALQPVAPVGLRPDQQGREHHERESEQEFALEGHGVNISVPLA